jgi:hypothetical protein
MSHTPTAPPSPAARSTLGALLPAAIAGATLITALAMPGCDVLSKGLGSVKAPGVGLNRVDLVDAPTSRQAIAWSCYEWLSSTACQVAGFDDKPTQSQMHFAFDLVFDLTNENTDLPIPLIEFLLGLTVIETENLGAVCVSFCDPEEEDCEPTRNAEGACVVDEETTDVNSADDLVPSVDDLVDLADAVLDGDVDNGSFRVIPAGETIESHIQFDLQPDTVYNLGRTLLEQAVQDYIGGDNVSVDIPYTVEGTAFFDVPEMGRYAAGFGPFEDTFPLE